MKRRDLFAGMGAASLAGPSLAQPAQNRVLKFVPQANLTSLDPIWTTANITRNHGYMIYDSLYGLDADFRPQPQMAAGHVIEQDGKRVVITLRDGLKFHDGEAVRAQDVVPSLTRWMRRNPFGQQLAAATDAVEVLDDKRLVFRLKKPFPLRGNGANAWFGWPTVPRIEELRDACFDATDLATEQRLAREMQIAAMEELPYIPVVAYMSITAHRSNQNGRVPGLALFWGIQRS